MIEITLVSHDFRHKSNVIYLFNYHPFFYLFWGNLSDLLKRSLLRLQEVHGNYRKESKPPDTRSSLFVQSIHDQYQVGDQRSFHPPLLKFVLFRSVHLGPPLFLTSFSAPCLPSKTVKVLSGFTLIPIYSRLRLVPSSRSNRECKWVLFDYLYLNFWSECTLKDYRRRHMNTLKLYIRYTLKN